MIKKKSIKDSYFDDSQLAMSYSSQARAETGRLEPVLNALAWAIIDIKKLAAAYKPEKVGAMSTNSDPNEHLRILKRSLLMGRDTPRSEVSG